MDTQQTDVTSIPPRAWDSFKSYSEANREWKQLPEDSGYILRIDAMDDPQPSPWDNFDKDGNLLPPKWQTVVHFTVVDYDDPQYIGQEIRDYFGISMHTKAKFYKLVKAAMGGDIDISWKPNPADLIGKTVVATLENKNPNSEGRVYPKIVATSVNRKKQDYSTVGNEPVVDEGPPPF